MLKYIISYLILTGITLVYICLDHNHYERKKTKLTREEVSNRIQRAYSNADNSDNRDDREYFLDVASYWEHELEKLDK